MTKELLQQALDALEEMQYASTDTSERLGVAAIAALKAAIAQPVDPHECETEAEKLAYAYGWWKALETKRSSMAQPDKPADAKDAARYRFLRANSYVEFWCDSPRVLGWTETAFDAATDKAMKQPAPTGGTP